MCKKEKPLQRSGQDSRSRLRDWSRGQVLLVVVTQGDKFRGLCCHTFFSPPHEWERAGTWGFRYSSPEYLNIEEFDVGLHR